MKKHVYTVAVISFLLVLLAWAPSPAFAPPPSVVHVYPGQSIQSAIGSVSPGGRVIVHAGVYHQSVVISNSLTLQGDGAILDGSPPADAGAMLLVDGIRIADGVSGVTIKGFEIRDYTGTGNGEGNGIQAWVPSTSDITVVGNSIHDNRWNAILVGNEGEGYHLRWSIKDNVVSNNGFYNIELTNRRDSKIAGNTVTGPGVSGILVQARNFDYGYFPGYSSPSTVTASGIVVAENTVIGFSYGIYLLALAGGTSGPRDAVLRDVTVAENEAHGNYAGVLAWAWSGIYGGTLATSNTVTDISLTENHLHGNTGPGAWLIRVTHSQLSENDVSDNERGIVLNDSDNNSLTENTALDNTSYGIRLINDSDDNLIEENTATGNGTYDLFQAPGCDNNVWRENTYGTSSGI